MACPPVTMQRGSLRVRKRHRSFGGCTSCRSRRLKCDERKPNCTHCSRSGRACDYGTHLFFTSDQDKTGEHKFRYRRPLLDEEERRCLSEQLIASVLPSEVLSSIEDVHERCEDLQGQHCTINVHCGPFGAFQGIERSSEPEKALQIDDRDVLPDEHQNAVERSSDTPEDDAFSSQLANQSTSHLAGLTAALQDLNWPAQLQTSVSFLYDHDLVRDDCNTFTEIRLRDMMDLSQNTAALETPLEINLDFFSPRIQGDRMSSETFSLTPPSPLSIADAQEPQRACALLKHYLANILPSYTPYLHGKTPWHNLFVPLVKDTLAGLALQEQCTTASLTVFYGTLALSAASLASNDSSNSWSDHHRRYLRRAHENFKKCIEGAYDLPKKAKYKQILMAILTMIQVAIDGGNREQAQDYLLEAEKYIRIRGLGRRKSRKIRLLHHCYAFERITFESTFTGPRSQRQRQVRREIEASGAGAYSKDALQFEILPDINELDVEMLKVKDQDTGENDLHLQKPGFWPASLYLEIFGLSEDYLFLISLIIRLARERDNDPSENNQHRGLTMQAFRKRAKMIERCVKAQRRAFTCGDIDLDALTDAFHAAITIYFYRTIYDVDSSMLQNKVSEVRDRLQWHEGSSSQLGRAAARLLWPAFIAACEADDSGDRTYFAEWFALAAQRSGLRMFDHTMANIEQVWQDRSQSEMIMYSSATL